MQIVTPILFYFNGFYSGEFQRLEILINLQYTVCLNPPSFQVIKKLRMSAWDVLLVAQVSC